MKKHIMTTILSAAFSMGLLFSGCTNTTAPNLQENDTIEPSISALPDEITPKTALCERTNEKAKSSGTPMETIENTDVVQGGPYGEISLSIPNGWNYEPYAIDSGQSTMGMYGIRFYPEGVPDGYIELTYTAGFGVCGTGLKQEKTVLAGEPANIGTYDNNIYWNFISFQDDYDGIVALTYSIDDWWETYSEQVMDILDTLSFDSSAKEGGAYINNNEYDLDQIGLSFTLKNISPAGATLVFCNYNADAPTGELEYGDDFWLEIQKDNVWEEVPVTLEGNYGFHAIAYVIPAEGCSEQELNWEWLYGTLAPGTYRIRKSIHDFRGSGDYDEYTAYAQFILN